MTSALTTILLKLEAQGAAISHLDRIAKIRDLAERSPHCLGIALVGSFAQNRGDRLSDLDLAAFVAENREAQFMTEVDKLLSASDVLHVFGQTLPSEVAFRKYVYLDFSSCEFHAFNQHSPFRLRPPYIPIWDPDDYLRSLVVDEPPPGHETFEPYPHGDEGLIWELLGRIKMLSRGHTHSAKSYLSKLGTAITSRDAIDGTGH